MKETSRRFSAHGDCDTSDSHSSLEFGTPVRSPHNTLQGIVGDGPTTGYDGAGVRSRWPWGLELDHSLEDESRQSKTPLGLKYHRCHETLSEGREGDARDLLAE